MWTNYCWGVSAGTVLSRAITARRTVSPDLVQKDAPTPTVTNIYGSRRVTSKPRTLSGRKPCPRFGLPDQKRLALRISAMEYRGGKQPVMRSRLRFVSSEYGRGNGQACGTTIRRRRRRRRRLPCIHVESYEVDQGMQQDPHSSQQSQDG